MKTMNELLRDGDPVQHEPPRTRADWDRLRRDVMAVRAATGSQSAEWSNRRRALGALLAVAVVGLVGMQIWPRGNATLEAAVRFEVRLAEEQPAPGLEEVQVAGSHRALYLHPETVVTNSDIVGARVVLETAAHFSISLTFNATGATKIERATADHIGRPMAILIDGQVVAAPRVTGRIGASALITGDFTKAEAERIANGVLIH